MSEQDSQQFYEFVEQLKRDDLRPEALNNILNLLLHKSMDFLSNSSYVGISKLVKCLNVIETNQVEKTCEILKLYFDKFPTGAIIKNYTSHMMYLLRHEKACVRRLAIDEVYRTVTSDLLLVPSEQYIDVFVAVAQLLLDDDIGIANKSILITSNLPKEAYPKILEELQISMNYKSNTKCNVFEVIINISSNSPELLDLCVGYGYIVNMLEDLNSNDVLYQLNILELLSRLASKPHGICYLIKHGALQRICDTVAVLDNNPLGNLLVPGYMKFFGIIAVFCPKEIFNKYPVLLELLFGALESNDCSVVAVALDTLGFIGNTIEGKLCLIALGSKYIQALDIVGFMIQNSPTELKVRALHCLASLIGYETDPEAPKSGPIDHRVTLMTREWFRSMSKHPLSIEILFETCKNPFPDIRLAAFALLDAICQHQWGVELVARTAGFVEYLLDRSLDHTKEVKESKYSIIKRISNSPSFDSNTILKLQAYVEQGPFYNETVMEVALEEGN